ncbi:MAG: uroporphyrinogen-III synthase [Pseudooceanicola sp.]|nr:uroporphyrinogen-III synthase [Pseudooceanicola sp.]
MATLLSTKKLKPNQKELILNAGLSFVEYDSIKTKNISFEIPHKLKNAIFTSQNAVNAYLKQAEKLPFPSGEGLGVRTFCVGEKTKELLEKNGLKVVEIGENASKVAQKIAKSYKSESFYFFTGNKRRDELPQILADSNIELTEIEVYKTSLNTKEFYQNFDGILFFSPSGVQSFAAHNKFGESLAICIGNTTATEARKHTQNIEIANSTSVESVIARAVKVLKNN